MTKIFVLIILCANISLAKDFKAQVNQKSNSLSLLIDNKKHEVAFSLPKDMVIENELQVFAYDKFNIVIMDLTDYSSASSLVFAISDSGAKLWELNLGAFNPAPPLVEDKFVYLSAIGKVWKVEKQTGKILWSHKDLYENKKYEFNGVEEIKRKGQWILFSKNLKVNDESGKIGGQN